jgi:hypothetical protein
MQRHRSAVSVTMTSHEAGSRALARGDDLMPYVKDPRVDAYLYGLPAWQREILGQVRDLVHAAGLLHEYLVWSDRSWNRSLPRQRGTQIGDSCGGLPVLPTSTATIHGFDPPRGTRVAARLPTRRPKAPDWIYFP